MTELSPAAQAVEISPLMVAAASAVVNGLLYPSARLPFRCTPLSLSQVLQ